jgi:hypothetical protein
MLRNKNYIHTSNLFLLLPPALLLLRTMSTLDVTIVIEGVTYRPAMKLVHVIAGRDSDCYRYHPEAYDRIPWQSSTVFQAKIMGDGSLLDTQVAEGAPVQMYINDVHFVSTTLHYHTCGASYCQGSPEKCYTLYRPHELKIYEQDCYVTFQYDHTKGVLTLQQIETNPGTVYTGTDVQVQRCGCSHAPPVVSTPVTSSCVIA